MYMFYIDGYFPFVHDYVISIDLISILNGSLIPGLKVRFHKLQHWGIHLQNLMKINNNHVLNLERVCVLCMLLGKLFYGQTSFS